MYQDNIVLCGASSYEQKYYFNQRDKRELLESLEMYYKVFFLGDIPDEELQKKADAVEE